METKIKEEIENFVKETIDEQVKNAREAERDRTQDLKMLSLLL